MQGFESSCLLAVLFPVEHQHDQGVESGGEHDCVFVNAKLGELDHDREGNRPQQQEEHGCQIQPATFAGQRGGHEDQGQRRGGAGKTAGYDPAREGPPDEDSDQGIAQQHQAKAEQDHSASPAALGQGEARGIGEQVCSKEGGQANEEEGLRLEGGQALSLEGEENNPNPAESEDEKGFDDAACSFFR